MYFVGPFTHALRLRHGGAYVTADARADTAWPFRTLPDTILRRLGAKPFADARGGLAGR